MQFSRSKQDGNHWGSVGAVLFASLAIAYPILVYLYRDRVPTLVFVSAACALLLARAFLFPGSAVALFRLPLLLGAVAIGLLSLLDAGIAAKAYPAVLSALVAIVFANSLRHPVSLVERFA